MSSQSDDFAEMIHLLREILAELRYQRPAPVVTPQPTFGELSTAADVVLCPACGGTYRGGPNCKCGTSAV